MAPSVQALASWVEQRFCGIEKIELGRHEREQEASVPSFIEIPAKEVEYENGRRDRVNAFTIAKRPVTIAEFDLFTSVAKYVTVAEQRGSKETFRNHFGLSIFSESSRDRFPAYFVARTDAEAFCQCMGYRLPTESEWLAASVVDPNEIEFESVQHLRRRIREVPVNAIQAKAWDLTATILPNGKVVARRGRYIFSRKVGGFIHGRRFNRRFLDAFDFDMSVTFRVIKVAAPSKPAGMRG